MSLEGVSSEPTQSTAIAPPHPSLASLPQDLLGQIFRRLNPRDLQAAACVSWGMNRSVTEAAHFHEPHSLKNFIKILMQKLPGQREVLEKIARNITYQNFPHLLLLKRSILDVKAQLIDVIKTVDAETVNSLHDVRPPHFLEDIFTLAAFERQIDEANLIPDDDRSWEALRNISQALARAGYMDRSLEVVQFISDEGKRGCGLRDISYALTQAGDIDRSLKIATSIPSEYTRGEALRAISKALARAGDMDRSLEVVQLIPLEGDRGEELRAISKALAGAGHMDQSLAAATSIPNENMRACALWDIVQVLIQAGDIDTSLAAATLIPDESLRACAFWDISHNCYTSRR